MIIVIVIPLFMMIISLLTLNIVMLESNKLQTEWVIMMRNIVLQQSIESAFQNKLEQVPLTKDCEYFDPHDHIMFESEDKVVLIFRCESTNQLMYQLKKKQS